MYSINLNIFNNKGLTDHSITKIAKRCNKLQFLDIGYGSDIMSKSLSEIMESLPNICGFLCFNPFCERMKVDRSCSKLKHLGIGGYRNYITDSTVHDIVQAHPQFLIYFNDEAICIVAQISNIFSLLFRNIKLSFF